MTKSCKYGTHRVVKPLGVLPQAAEIINPTPVAHDNECLVDVDTLNIDSASFHQIRMAARDDVDVMKDMILDIVKTRGKMQNPVTKSGGMLLGRVKEIGSAFHDRTLTPGTKIATLVSLSLTPLWIEEILSIDLKTDQVDIRGQAIVFDSGVYARIPEDIEEKLALATLDVAGAPAQVDKLAKEGDTVLIIGGAGKSGLLCARAAKDKVGPHGRIIGLVNETAQRELLETLPFYDAILLADAQNPLAVYEAVCEATDGSLADLTLNVVNVENTEMTSVLATREGGTVYFFSMATSFTKAALGAEGVGKDVTMIIGNGYTANHAVFALDILRRDRHIRTLFSKRYT